MERENKQIWQVLVEQMLNICMYQVVKEMCIHWDNDIREIYKKKKRKKEVKILIVKIKAN